MERLPPRQRTARRQGKRVVHLQNSPNIADVETAKKIVVNCGKQMRRFHVVKSVDWDEVCPECLEAYYAASRVSCSTHLAVS